ncbi:MAG TPA: rRNA maturation RNase YbeY [Gemmatimonadales bacterium]|nr:rRNA maturation RNase YbeY [Gemmatimonadales bacterium]
MSVARPPLPAATVRRVVDRVLRGERRRAEIAVTFLGPTRMRALNRAHLGHDRVTDVISFALPGPGGRLVGDVYVCRAEAARQARRHGVPLREELVRLVVHGTLHVLGHDHPAGEERTRSPMWRRQERYVRRLA